VQSLLAPVTIHNCMTFSSILPSVCVGPFQVNYYLCIGCVSVENGWPCNSAARSTVVTQSASDSMNAAGKSAYLLYVYRPNVNKLQSFSESFCINVQLAFMHIYIFYYVYWHTNYWCSFVKILKKVGDIPVKR